MKLYDNDSYRDSFTELVYALLNDDTTWDRANQIIEAFDSAPAVEVPDSIHPHGGPVGDSIEIVKPAEGNPHTFLKPCRICGNTEIVYERYRHQAGERWRCWCTKCLACIDPGWAQNRLAVRDIWNQEPPNEPLTMEELREMAQRCEGIYVANIDGSPVFRDQMCCAAVLDFSQSFGSNTMHVHAIYGDRLKMREDEYGKTWIAYRRKPLEMDDP